ncbi:MAG: TolC family protein, partial [Planctomycetes bacterium]|nr:TolC family protein [Planctomycetota bacterium]
MRRFAFPAAALAILPLAISGCVGERTLQRTLPATPTPGVSATAMASTPSLAEPVAVPAGTPLVLTMAECVQRALRDNRGFQTKLGERIVAELATTIARSQVYAPRLAASYTESNQSGEDHGAASVTAATPLLGFTITPFVRDDFDPANVDTGDSHVSSYGVTLSHSLLNLHDHVAQRLPVNRADMNLMKAANSLLLEAKRVELETTRAFLRAQNAMASTKVRERRVADAEQFLAS